VSVSTNRVRFSGGLDAKVSIPLAKSRSFHPAPEAAMTTNRLILPVALTAVTRALWAAIQAAVRGVKLVVRRAQNRRQAAVLAHLEARMLADIGLTRADVRDAASARLWEDPTELLRDRAVERRRRSGDRVAG
jgi:uncharacterized protein YjiS (DUF1127 family)